MGSSLGPHSRAAAEARKKATAAEWSAAVLSWAAPVEPPAHAASSEGTLAKRLQKNQSLSSEVFPRAIETAGTRAARET